MFSGSLKILIHIMHFLGIIGNLPLKHSVPGNKMTWANIFVTKGGNNLFYVMNMHWIFTHLLYHK
jgi:hypothetical protein